MLLLYCLILGQKPPAFDYAMLEYERDRQERVRQVEKALTAWKPDKDYWTKPPINAVMREALLTGTWKTYSTKLVFRPTAAYEKYSVTYTEGTGSYHGADPFDLPRTATCKNGLVTLDRPVGSEYFAFQHLYVISSDLGLSLLPASNIKDNWSPRDGKLPPREGWYEGYRLFRYGLDWPYL